MPNYEQLQKNDVPATDQLKDLSYIRFFNLENTGKRVMFVGNSITLHGPSEALGWRGEWGMAASSAENDYVHRLMTAISEQDPNCAFCICQVSQWECQYQAGSEILNLYESARRFQPDIIVMRFVENCPRDNYDPNVFKKEATALLKYLNPTNNARIILTTGFWHHPADEAIVELSEELNLPLVKLGDLGENKAMKAIGLFEHAGVGNHPGDLGMKNIADRIFDTLKNYL